MNGERKARKHAEGLMWARCAAFAGAVAGALSGSAGAAQHSGRGASRGFLFLPYASATAAVLDAEDHGNPLHCWGPQGAPTRVLERGAGAAKPVPTQPQGELRPVQC